MQHVAKQIITLCGIVLLAAATGCGAVHDVLDQADSTQAQWKAQALAQGQQKCTEAGGTFSDVTVAACTDGNTVVQAGQVRQTQACTGGKATHYEGQCLQRDAQDQIYFSDGPSTPYGFLNYGEDLGEGTDLITWNGFFWPAGLNHDYCYHHGAATYDLTQADCDGQMLDDLVALCSVEQNASIPWFTKDRCTTNAQIMYAAVKAFGADNFERMSTRVQYPTYVPLWRTLGLAQAPDDPNLRDAIDKVL